MIETVRIPIFHHPCIVCGNALAPFGVHGNWYCQEHRP